MQDAHQAEQRILKDAAVQSASDLHTVDLQCIAVSTALYVAAQRIADHLRPNIDKSSRFAADSKSELEQLTGGGGHDQQFPDMPAAAAEMLASMKPGEASKLLLSTASELGEVWLICLFCL